MANHSVGGRQALNPRPCPRLGVPGGDGSAALTETELAAAQQLVLLSGSSSEDTALQAASRTSSASSSSLPSVGNARLPQPPASPIPDDKEEDEDEEGGISTGPSTRRRRYRSIRQLYDITNPIDGHVKWGSAAQRRKNSRA